MYPCSFVLYLKQHYSTPDNQLVFTHTIKPMVDTMRMHPNLICSSKEVETSVNRWKKMEQHDVVMECTKYTLLENGDRNYQNPSSWTNTGSSFSSALDVLKSSVGATGDITSVNSVRNKELWSPMSHCGEFYKDTIKSMPTTPNLQNFYKAPIFNHMEYSHSPPEAAVEATPETTPNRITDSTKEENNARSEPKPIAAQIQQTSNPEIIQTGDEDVIECDQQSNGSPCQTHEGGLHMPDTSTIKEFVKIVQTRKRYHSQCTPEKTIDGQSTGSSPINGQEFPSLSVRRANSCPEIKKANGSSISSGTSALQEEIEEDLGDGIHVSNGHTSEMPKNEVPKLNQTTQTDNKELPYEHLFYSIFPEYNDTLNSIKGQQNTINNQEDNSLCLIEKYVRTSAIVLKHRHTAESTDNVQLLKSQIVLLTLQLQFERNRREVHAERNRRLLGKSRSSRALDEHNSALKDQVSMLQVELENVTSGYEQFRQTSSKQIKDLQASVSHWKSECLKYQEETKEAKNNCLSLEQRYNGERVKTADVTKQLSETKAELFNTLSELSIVQATADMSKELKNTVINLQRELVMCGELQSRQRDVVTHINALRYDATNAMLSQESYRHHLNELQDKLYNKSALLDASNARIADLELRLNTKNANLQNDKREIELVKEHYNHQLSKLKEECRILKEMQCQYKENKEEEESKNKFLKDLPKFNSDVALVESSTSVSDQDTKFRLNMMFANIDESRDDAPAITTTLK
ncbi:Hypothetical protein CINCED_3A011113 [Cinara cedri]|nr:Hypothetical protein CINCED_3A011113 [Cinara cedri]